MDADYISRIKELKKEKGINTEQLAAMSGVPVGTLSKMLCGVADSVKLSNLTSVCKALGVSLDYIVFGIPVNNNNYTLNPDEAELIDGYRRLDVYSRELVRSTVRIECTRADREQERAAAAAAAAPARRGRPARKTAAIMPSPSLAASYTETAPDSPDFSSADASRRERRRINLFELAVSAGPGQYLDSDVSDITISIPAGQATDKADYAVRISGHSMEPRYHNGDILLVEKTDTVDVGDLCIYALDGEGYFKVFGGDCLISLNPEFGKILLRDYESVVCCGRVLSKLKKSTARK